VLTARTELQPRDNITLLPHAALQNTPTLYLFTAQNAGRHCRALQGFFTNTRPARGGLPYGRARKLIHGQRGIERSRARHTNAFFPGIHYQQMNRGYGAYAQAVEKWENTSWTGFGNLDQRKPSPVSGGHHPQGHFPCSLAASGVHHPYSAVGGVGGAPCLLTRQVAIGGSG